MDARVLPLVAALNARGIPTWGSCDGHPDTFPRGVWYPWVYLGDDDIIRDRRGVLRRRPEALRVDPIALERAVWELIRAWYAIREEPKDEIYPVISPLGISGSQALVPHGCFPGGGAHRVIGRHLGLKGRRDIYERAWREFDPFTQWLMHGTSPEGPVSPPAIDPRVAVRRGTSCT